LKAKIDELKAALDEKEKSRLPPIDGVLVIDEPELKIRQNLRDVKHQYKENYQRFYDTKEHEQTLLNQIDEQEAQLERDFALWIEEQDKQAVTETEEEEDNEELLDKDEKRERREYQKAIQQDPKAGPFFFAYKKVQKILEREFRPNGTRRQPVTE
jgi:ATPase subunit of ABC transporter with duplicated ATPase domains